MWRNTPSNAFAPSDAPETRQTMVTQDYAYFGGLFRGFKSGFGTIIFNDNSVYSGTFHEDQFSGNGTFIYANGAVLSGAFSRGELVQGTVTFQGQTNEIKGGLWRHMFGQVAADAPRQPQVAPSQVPPQPRYGGAFEQEVLSTMKHLAHTTQTVQLDVTRMQGELQKQSQRQEATSQVVQELKKQMVSLEEWKRIPAKVQQGAPDIPAKPFVYQPPAMPAPPQVPAKVESKTSQKPAVPQINPQPQVIPPQVNQPPQAAAIEPESLSKATIMNEFDSKRENEQEEQSTLPNENMVKDQEYNKPKIQEVLEEKVVQILESKNKSFENQQSDINQIPPQIQEVQKEKSEDKIIAPNTETDVIQKTDTKKEFTAQNGIRYVGFWKDDDYQNGRGTIFEVNGNVYEGAWINNLYDGEAIYTYKNNLVFTGSFLLGKKEGQGVVRHQNGKIIRGTFKNGQIMESDTTYSNGNQLKNGKLTLQNGDSCEMIDKTDSNLISYLSKINGFEELTEEQKKLITNIKYAQNKEQKAEDEIERHKEKVVQEVAEQPLPAKEETTPVYNKDLFNQPPVVGTTFGTVLPEVQQVKYDEVLIHLESFPLKTAQKLIPLITKQFPSINVDVQGVDIIMMVPSDQTAFVLYKMKKIVVNKQLLTISVNGLYVQLPDSPPGIAQPDVQEPAQKHEVQEFAYQPPVADHVPLGVYEEEPKLKQHKLADGTTYVGKWEGDDFRNGEGTIENWKGNVYEGKWVDDYFEGHGVYRYASGFVFEGNFHKGLKQGYGTYACELYGLSEKGIFENGRLVRDYEVTYLKFGNVLRSDKIMTFGNGEQWQLEYDDVEDELVKKLGKSRSVQKAKLSEQQMSRIRQIFLPESLTQEATKEVLVEKTNYEDNEPKMQEKEQISVNLEQNQETDFEKLQVNSELNQKETSQYVQQQESAQEEPGLDDEPPGVEPIKAENTIHFVQLQVNLEAFNQKEIIKIITKIQEYLNEYEKVEQQGQFAVLIVKESNIETVTKQINRFKLKDQKLVCTLKLAENAEEPPGLDQPQEPFVQAPQEVKKEEPPGLGETIEDPPGLEGDLIKQPEQI
ncbi:phosphatidylinositol-4-phosphate_5-kinase [Hexamita inflata]|uniref:Phosphatidylinositol-4-phosphate 5-kinase n=1 Tax=Hexamita inflata TaxID=28002 RepID=A0AA86RFA2_9EUKA|nr:phosphatidylinositol-4-phosphate 5-kinase [Hexamita inflata]